MQLFFIGFAYREDIITAVSAYALFTCLTAKLCSSHSLHFDHNEFHASGYPYIPLPLVPLEQLPHSPARQTSPAEIMVDLTNDLTNRILHYHSILNRNNFAFSPTALMSVLVALYEGSAGRSATELKNGIQLPNNRDIIRIGNRDIQRKLRTYLCDSINTLKGLSLNKNNVTILRDYETILMFYGYGLGSDMIYPLVAQTMPENSTSTMGNVTEKEKAKPLEMESETTTAQFNVLESTTIIAETQKPETTEPTETEATPIIESTNTERSIETTESATNTAEDGSEATTETAAELVSVFVAEADAEPLLRIQKARVTKLPTSKLQAPLKPSFMITPKPNYLPSAKSVTFFPITSTPNTTPNAKPKKLPRPKRHVLKFKELDDSLFVSLFNPPPRHHIFPLNADIYSHIPNQFRLDVDTPVISEHTSRKENYNTDVISHVFYLDDQEFVHTTFKVYNAVLYYKHFERLKMSVLELELDTNEYNLMIVLPEQHLDIVTAAVSLKTGPTLRLLRKQLKPRWVQAIIPDFKLQGTLFLTNDLQNIGICDIFEPNRADFRPMTDEKGIYVKHIEQSINVNIRTHPINQLKRNFGAQKKPIQISVNHPFIFFIVDRDLDLAVMAGRILNPLNVRIQ